MKIHICGIYGSGKTTLAKYLSEEFNIPFYSLDDIKYVVKFSKIRSVEEIKEKVNEISKNSDWITEGSWSDFAEPLFKEADLIIHLKVPRLKCIYGILKRYLGRKKEENDDLLGVWKLIKKVHKYYYWKKPISAYAHSTIIAKHKKHHLILTNTKNILKKIETIY
jgi:adenylate kinase family enzyme